MNDGFGEVVDIVTVVQNKIIAFDKTLMAKYEKDKSFDLQEINKKVEPLIDEALQEDKLWKSDGAQETPMFETLLSPSIGVIDGKDVANPYFSYALLKLILNEKKTYKKDTICVHLLLYLSDDKYREHHKSILNILFHFFNKKEYYNHDAVWLIEKKITQDHNGIILLPRYLLLLYITNDRLRPSIKYELKKLADQCSGLNNKNLSNWIALVLLARNGDSKYIRKMAKIVKKVDNSSAGIMKATYMFPFMSLVPQDEIVSVMKDFLNDDIVIDQGDDVNQRYKGLSILAAETLYIMLDNFQKISSDHYDKKEREKCMEWFRNNKTYRFREVNYFTSKEGIISQAEYMIFEAQ